MLTFQQKMDVLDAFAELERKTVSLGRVNYHFEGSLHEKKNVVYHLHPNGNGFVYVGQSADYPADEKGLVNIRDFDAEQLRAVVAASIALLSTPPPEKEPAAPKRRKKSGAECWVSSDGQRLDLKFEEDLWYLYTGLNLEMAFETYEEAEQYLQEEGFVKQ
ncbi:hypothetical protein [Paenibacillus sp. GCM10027626]|uniref:hypothetical protein n=1 Tax=Paenibacillus sp. GCM10027626 TaxID=3273411 RepID=UPI003639D5AC